MRPRGANTRSRLLCPRCSELRKVKLIEDGHITLTCGHLRTEILPVQPGHISLEDLRTAIGQRLFPLSRRYRHGGGIPWPGCTMQALAKLPKLIGTKMQVTLPTQ